jgi:hypothetical protein
MYSFERFENIEILAETTVEVSENGGLAYVHNDMKPLTIGGNYLVNWNGTEYNCVCFEGGDGYAVLYISGVFSMGYNIYTNEGLEVRVNDGSTSVTLSIVGTYENVHKIDKKYIDLSNVYDQINNIYNNVFLTSPNGTRYKITVADDGTLAATAV